MAETVKVGIIGTGNIAPQYIHGCRAFEILDVVACADLNMERAQAFADVYELTAMSVEDMLKSDDIQIIINLTIPNVHAKVSAEIIQAGKHVYSEKPLGVERTEGEKLLETAKNAGVLVGCAPDTFLGGGGQTCRKLIEDGAIGEPIGAVAFMMSHGPESWHPNPDFFYKFGAGPMFDMGPYYLTALVNLLGPIKTVSAMTRVSFPERIATSEALNGHKIGVEVPTHYSGTLGFASGPIATMVISFDVWQAQLPRIEIYGSEGTLSVPDPNTFGGPVRIWKPTDGQWRDVELTHSDTIGRGIGVADMAYSIMNGRTHRASGDLALHVLEVMQSFGESSERGQAVTIQSQPEQPKSLPVGLAEGMLDT